MLGASIVATHKDLDVWKEAIDMVTNIYRLTAEYPDSEKFGLVSQMRRAAVSVPSNIAEGAARGTNKEYVHFLNISLGSLSELETQVLISQNLEYLEPAKILKELELIRAKLYKLRNYLKTKIKA